MKTVIKECKEEAGIPEKLSITARPAGTLRYIKNISVKVFSFDMYLYQVSPVISEATCRRETYLRNGVAKIIVHVIKHVNSLPNRVCPDRVVRKNRQLREI